MTIYHFNKLNEEDQINTIEQDGVLVSEREDSFCYIKLYQIENFYVEFFYHSHFNVLINIHAFKNMACLDPYLQNMDVEALIYN